MAGVFRFIIMSFYIVLTSRMVHNNAASVAGKSPPQSSQEHEMKVR